MSAGAFADLEGAADINRLYATLFAEERRPARTNLAATLIGLFMSECLVTGFCD
jgi:hypothetical protein